MRIRIISTHSDATALWRLSMLSVVALAVGIVIFVVVRRSAERSAETAVLYFDSSVAAQNDEALAHAANPALTVAQSMLDETTVLYLLRQAGVYPPDPTVGIGEFRSRLSLQETSGGMLQVLYRDSDPSTARKVANAVATGIVNWKPAEASPPAPGQPQIGSMRALPVHAHALSRPAGDALSLAYRILADLEGQLAATDEKIGDLSRSPASPRQTPSAAPPPSAQNEQRRILAAKLAAAQQRLDDLRLRYTDEYPDVENTKDEISALQQELAALPPATTTHPNLGNDASIAERHDTEIAELRQRRTWLTGQIEAETHAIDRIRPDRTANIASSSHTALVPPIAPRAVSPAPTVTKTVGWQNPFRIARLTTVTRDRLAWPAILAGGLSLLFFAVSAACLVELWRSNKVSLRHASIPQTHRSIASDSQVPIWEPTPPSQAPIAAGPDGHVTMEQAMTGTPENASAFEVRAVSSDGMKEQQASPEKMRQGVVDAELIEASAIEARITSPADDVSEVELTSREKSKAGVREPEPIESPDKHGPRVYPSAVESDFEPSAAVEREPDKAVSESAEEKRIDPTPRELFATGANEIEAAIHVNSQLETTVAERVEDSHNSVQRNSIIDLVKAIEFTYAAGVGPEMHAAESAEPPGDDLAEMLENPQPVNPDGNAGNEPPELAETGLEAETGANPGSASAPQTGNRSHVGVEKEPPVGKDKDAGSIFADSDEVDAEWVARISNVLARTSSAQIFEGERPPRP